MSTAFLDVFAVKRGSRTWKRLGNRSVGRVLRAVDSIALHELNTDSRKITQGESHANDSFTRVSDR